MTDQNARVDPYDTAGIRAAVLAAWGASAARLREDANAEEALALGGYAGRAVVELVANGVDAARSAGVPARILIRWPAGPDGTELRVANTGAGLTPAGVAGLASLRASGKRDESGSVGHFGVGFTAVLGLSPAPEVVSALGAVQFSPARSAAAVADLGPAQAAELRAREGRGPVLRLPFAAPVSPEDPVPSGFVTEVRLPVPPDTAAAAEKAIDEVGPDLFWAVPGLTELSVHRGGRMTTWRWRELAGGRVEINGDGAGRRFLTVHREGTVPAGLLADRPIEERHRTLWWLTWFRPDADPADAEMLRPDEVDVPLHRLGAPVPTDEQLTIPARLIGTFPVDETRRHLAAGPLADLLLREAAAAYVELFEQTRPAQRWRLIPGQRFPAGDLDGLLRTEILSALAEKGRLAGVLGDAVPVAEAVQLPHLPPAALVLMAQAMPGLVASPGSTAEADALRRLGVRVAPPGEASSALSGLSRPPDFYRALYEQLEEQDPDDWRDLPVPLASGRIAIGARGTLLPGDVPEDLLTRLVESVPVLPLVAPVAASRFLLRLGAERADAAALLAAEPVRRRFADFRDLLDESDPDPDEVDRLGALALDLLAAGATAAPDLLLTDQDGEPWPAAELLLPGAPLAAVLSDEADLPTLAGRWATAYPADVLRRGGVRDGLAVAAFPIVDGEPAGSGLDALPDLDQWWDEAPAAARTADSLLAVPDLDLVDPDRWPQALALLAADRDTRAAVLTDPEGYTAWWIGRYATVAGVPVGHWRLPGARELAGLFDVFPVGSLDPAFAAALGALPDLAGAVRRCPAELVSRYGDPGRVVPIGAVARITAAVLDLLAGGADLPDRVRTLDGRAVDPDEAVVLDLPWWAQVLPAGELVPGGTDPQRTAEWLELDTASERGAHSAVPLAAVDPIPVDHTLVADVAASLGLSAPVGTTFLAVPGLAVKADGDSIPVSWWPAGDDWLTDGSPAGIGRAVAWATGCWAERLAAVAAAGGAQLVFFETAVDQPAG